MKIKINLPNPEAEKILGEHSLKTLSFQDTYDADVSLDRYSGVEIELTPKATESSE